MKSIVAILFASVFTGGVLSAQLSMGGTATIAGTDPSGANVPNATVVAAAAGTVPVVALAAVSQQENAPGNKPVRIGGAVMAANLITKVTPAYPADMKEQRQEATVVLQATISKDGVPQSLSVETTDVNRSFIDAAIEAVKQWRYRPTLLNGEPVEVITNITINFTLSQ
jgi:TonB family protein